MKKKIIKIVSAILISFLIVACGNKTNKEIVEEPVEELVDIDLTTLSKTMVYSQVYDMVVLPENYIGKTVRMKGQFIIYQNDETGQIYFACLISDATACCAQGIEFELEGDYSYPLDYPELGSEIVVNGIFNTYEEDGYLYCNLVNAAFE